MRLSNKITYVVWIVVVSASHVSGYEGHYGPSNFKTAAVAYAMPIDGITLDGKIDDWPKHFPRYQLVRPYHPYGQSDLVGELHESRDLSAFFLIGWNMERQLLYVAVVVDDDDHVPTNPVEKANPAECDSVELYFDGLHAERHHPYAERSYPASLAAIQHVAIAGPDLPFRTTGPGKTNPYVSGIDVNKTPHDCRWTHHGRRSIYEWQAVLYDQYPTLTKLEPGKRVGFDLIVSDLDRRDGQIIDHAAWVPFGAHGRMKMSDASTLADLVLLGPDDLLVNVSGTVHSGGRMKPVAGVRVRFYRSNQIGSYPTGEAVTDVKGRWSLPLPPGSHHVTTVDHKLLGPDRIKVEQGRREPIELRVE